MHYFSLLQQIQFWILTYCQLYVPWCGLSKDAEAGPDRHWDIQHVEKEERTNMGPVFTWGENEQGDTLELGRQCIPLYLFKQFSTRSCNIWTILKGGLQGVTRNYTSVSCKHPIIFSVLSYPQHSQECRLWHAWEKSPPSRVQWLDNCPCAKPRNTTIVKAITHCKLHTKPDRQSRFNSYPHVIAAIMSKYMR